MGCQVLQRLVKADSHAVHYRNLMTQIEKEKQSKLKEKKLEEKEKSFTKMERNLRGKI